MTRLAGVCGYLIGVVIGVMGLALYSLWADLFRHRFLEGRLSMAEAFLELGILVVLQSSIVVGILWCINRRRSRW